MRSLLNNLMESEQQWGPPGTSKNKLTHRYLKGWKDRIYLPPPDPWLIVNNISKAHLFECFI